MFDHGLPVWSWTTCLVMDYLFGHELPVWSWTTHCGQGTVSWFGSVSVVQDY